MQGHAHNWKDLAGQRFGRLLVLEEADSIDDRTRWRCKCDCGVVCDILTTNLTGGITKSCGCLRKERTIAFNQTKKGTHWKK